MNAGVIEGFFGKPWDWPARLTGIDFLRDWGYEFYVYAPKADPFLRRRWREPLPEDTLHHLSDLGDHAASNGISIGVGLTPFDIHLNYDAAARAALRAKVRQIDESGANLLCILFDDMRGDVGDLAALQAQVVGDISAWSRARRFIVCPTYYSYDSRLTQEFGAAPASYLQDLGRSIDPRIDIFWTGEKVISEGYSTVHLSAVTAQLRRKPFIWDNSISNDSKLRTNHLYLDPAAGAWALPVDSVAGLAINPMNQAHLSRIALCSFRQLLVQTPAAEAASPAMACYETLCGPDIAAQIRADTALIQGAGLDQIDPTIRRELLARYAAAVANPYAQEIAGWLRNDYRFDPQCLTN